jgi:hypothetical protein
MSLIKDFNKTIGSDNGIAGMAAFLWPIGIPIYFLVFSLAVIGTVYVFAGVFLSARVTNLWDGLVEFWNKEC